MNPTPTLAATLFVKTPTNILRQGLEFSPAGALTQAVRRAAAQERKRRRAWSSARPRQAIYSGLRQQIVCPATAHVTLTIARR